MAATQLARRGRNWIALETLTFGRCVDLGQNARTIYRLPFGVDAVDQQFRPFNAAKYSQDRAAFNRADPGLETLTSIHVEPDDRAKHSGIVVLLGSRVPRDLRLSSEAGTTFTLTLKAPTTPTPGFSGLSGVAAGFLMIASICCRSIIRPCSFAEPQRPPPPGFPGATPGGGRVRASPSTIPASATMADVSSRAAGLFVSAKKPCFLFRGFRALCLVPTFGSERGLRQAEGLANGAELLVFVFLDRLDLVWQAPPHVGKTLAKAGVSTETPVKSKDGTTSKPKPKAMSSAEKEELQRALDAYDRRIRPARPSSYSKRSEPNTSKGGEVKDRQKNNSFHVGPVGARIMSSIQRRSWARMRPVCAQRDGDFGWNSAALRSRRRPSPRLKRHGSISTPGLSRPCGSSAFFAARSAAANSGGRWRSYHGR